MTGGGSSANSGGIIYLGGGTPIQEGCGFEDTPEDMFAFLVAACGPGADEAKIRVWVETQTRHQLDVRITTDEEFELTNGGKHKMIVRAF